MYVGPTTVEDWQEYATDGNIYIEPDGRAVVAPLNYHLNSSFEVIGKDGSPLHHELVLGQQQIGSHAYLSVPPGGAETTSRQSTEILPMGTSSYTANFLVSQGPLRPPKDERLPRAQMGAVRNETAGYAAGLRRIAYTWATKSRQQTEPSERTEFTLGASFGGLELVFEDEPPPSARYRIIYMTEVGGGELWQQAVIDANRKSYKMWGPFRKGRKAPTVNETRLGQARQPLWGDRRELRIGNGSHALDKNTYRVRFQEADAVGEGLASPRSEPRKIDKIKPETAIIARIRHSHPDSNRFRVIVEINGINYVVTKSFRATNWFGLDSKVEIYGHLPDTVDLDSIQEDIQAKKENLRTEEDKEEPDQEVIRTLTREIADLEREMARQKSVANEAGNWFLEEFDLPTEDTSGIPEPTDPPAAPIPLGLALPVNALYWGTYAPLYGEEHLGGLGPSAPLDSVQVNTGFVPQVTIPNLANMLKNAEHTHIGRDGKPHNMNFEGSFPSYVDDGRMGFITGVRTDATNSPTTTYDPIEINRDDVWVARGSALARSVVSGTGRVILEFLDAAGAVISGESVTCASIGTNDQIDWKIRIGPSDATPSVDKAYPANAVQIRYKINFANTTVGGGQQRNMTFEVFNMAIHPFDGAPRKFEMPALGSGDTAGPNPTPEVPYRSGNVVVITEPPRASGVTGFTPIQKADFSSGAVPVGYSPSTGSGGTVQYLSAAAINGLYGMRVQNASTSGVGFAYIERTYSGMNGKNIALHELYRLTQLPTTGDNVGVLGSALRGSDGKCIVSWMWNRYGQLRRRVVDRFGTRYEKTIARGLVNGDRMDLEIVVSGGNTNQARIFFYAGKNGKQRRLVDTMSGVKFGGAEFKLVQSGIRNERLASQQWTFDIDDIVVTRSGDELQPRTTTPPDVALPSSDRPTITGFVLDQDTAPQLYTHGSDQGRMAVQGQWDITANPGSDATLAEITTNAGTILADVIQKTDNRLTVRTRSATGAFTEYVLKTGITQPARHGAEIVISGVGSSGGSITAYYISPSGAKTAQIYALGENWEGQAARKANTYSTAQATNAQSIATLAGVTEVAERDSQDRIIKQLYIFKHPLIRQRNIGIRGQVATLSPGETYTVAWWMRWDFAGTVPSFPLRYYLKNNNGDTIDLGSLLGADGAAGTSGWQDRYMLITPDLVPEGYTQLWMDTGTYEQGEFVAQHPLCGKGSLTTQDARNSARFLGRAAQGIITATIPMHLPIESPYNIALGYKKLRDLYADPTFPTDEDDNQIGTASVRYATSPQSPPVSWSAWEDDPVLLPPGRTGKIEVTLNTNGFDGPSLEVGDLGLNFTHDISTLCRLDGSTLPGGVLVNGLENAISSPDYNSEPVLGRARNDPVTDPIRRITRPVTCIFFSEDAYVEFFEEALERDWRFEAPGLGPNGLFMVFRPYDRPTLGGQNLFSQMKDELRRYVVGELVINSAEVTEQGALAWGEENI